MLHKPGAGSGELTVRQVTLRLDLIEKMFKTMQHDGNGNIENLLDYFCVYFLI